MERLFSDIIEALRDPEVSKEDILQWISHEYHVLDYCEDCDLEYEPSSFFYSNFYHGSRYKNEDYSYEDIIEDDICEEDFISDELPTHTLGDMLRYKYEMA